MKVEIMIGYCSNSTCDKEIELGEFRLDATALFQKDVCEVHSK